MANTKKQKSLTVIFSVSKINLVNKHLTLSEEIDYSDVQYYKFSLTSTINLFKDKSIIQVAVNYKFLYKDIGLLEMTVENDFQVKNLNSLLVDGKVPSSNFLTDIVEMSINHTRGIQSTIIKNTPIDNLLIPPLPNKKIMEGVRHQSEQELDGSK